MQIEITIMISVCTALVGMALGLLSAKRAQMQQADRQSRETATIISEIGYVKAGIDAIKQKQEKQDERHYNLISRVASLETGVSQLQALNCQRPS